MLDAAPDGVITIDDHGVITELNTAAERMFGFTRSSAIGRKVGDLLVPESQRPSHEAGLRRVAAGGESRIIGRRVRLAAQRSDNREIMVELLVTRTGDAPPRFTAWIRELSEHEADTATADEERALLAAGEEIVPVGSWEWTPSESKLLWSETVYRILGVPNEVTPNAAIGLRLAHPDDRERLRSGQAKMAASGELPEPVEYRIVRPDGELRHLRVSLAVAEVRAGQPYRFVGLVEDLTEPIRAHRAIAAHKAVTEAIAGWAAFEQGAPALLTGLAAALECQGAIFWLPRENELVARIVWRVGTADPALLDQLQPGSPQRRGGGLAWTAHTAHEAVRARSALAIPAVFGEETLAVIELRSRDALGLPEPTMRSLTGIGDELGRFLDQHRDGLDLSLLSPRELEVVALAAQGLSAKQIAERLFISPDTVSSHFKNLYSKLGVSDRAAAVAAALRLRLID